MAEVTNPLENYHPDVLDLIRCFHKYQVDFLIIGGWAVIIHGYARTTVDYDFFYRKSVENAKNLFAALTDFFSGRVPGIRSARDLLTTDNAFWGERPNRVDVMNQISGVDFDRAADGKIPFPLLDDCFVISFEALLRNKLASGRKKDLADVEELEKIRAAKKRLARNRSLRKKR